MAAIVIGLCHRLNEKDAIPIPKPLFGLWPLGRI